MPKYTYEVNDNTIQAVNYESEVAVYNVDEWQSKKIRYYKSLLSIRYDMERARAYLNQMFFDDGTTLIDGALINASILLLVRCFSNPTGNGRKDLDINKVFRTYSLSIGERDYTTQFEALRNGRNTVIAHDQDVYKENIVGLTVNNKTGLAEDIAEIICQRPYLNRQNQQIVLSMVDVVYSYTVSCIDNLKKNIIDEYNNSKDVVLEILQITDVQLTNSW